jgi:uncharacterized protein (DUF1501 family)
MSLNRRFFIKSGAVALAGVGTADLFLPSMAEALTNQSPVRKSLILIFQRGAVDGLNMVIPYKESEYYKYRPNIAIPANAHGESVLNLDGFFGLHPAMNQLVPLFNDKRLAIVHACGSHNNTRSHFDAQDFMESGTPGIKSTADGWLNRYLQVTDVRDRNAFRAVSITRNLPRIFYGKYPALSIDKLSNFDVRNGSQFESIYGKDLNDPLNGTGRDTFDAIKFLKKVNLTKYMPETGAQYPAGRFGSSLLQLAQLIKAGAGLQCGFTEIGGWDTHANQGGARGKLANRLKEFSDGITAFTKDLGKHMDNVLILTMSEFGRTVRENGNSGTDHGHGNAMLVIGNMVKGGKVYGDWPGLKNDQLYEGRDLAITTDFRDVVSEIAVKHMGARNLGAVFPGHSVVKKNFRGLI